MIGRAYQAIDRAPVPWRPPRGRLATELVAQPSGPVELPVGHQFLQFGDAIGQGNHTVHIRGKTSATSAVALAVSAGAVMGEDISRSRPGSCRDRGGSWSSTSGLDALCDQFASSSVVHLHYEAGSEQASAILEETVGAFPQSTDLFA